MESTYREAIAMPQSAVVSAGPGGSSLRWMAAAASQSCLACAVRPPAARMRDRNVSSST
jgi:hypothetical protein